MSEEIKKYDKNNNVIYKKYSNGSEYWWKYDKNNNKIYFKNTDGNEYLFEYWQEYDENNNWIHYKNSDGFEKWYKYDELNNYQISITEQEFKEIRFRKKEKEYNSRTKCSRFELMEI